jgi:ribosomal protein S20
MKQRSMKMRKGVVGLALVVGLVGGSLFTMAVMPLGVADALVGATPSPSTSHQSVLQQALDTLVGKGTITKDQADAVKNQVHSLEQQHPHGFGGPGGPGRGGLGLSGLGRDPIAQLAALVKTDPKTLLSDLASGQSIAQVATANGVDPTSVVNSLVTSAGQQLDQAVKNGWMTQTQADALKAKLPATIKALVDQTWPSGFGFHGFGRGPGAMMPGWPGATPPSSGSEPTPAAPPATTPPTTAPPTTVPPTTAPPITATPTTPTTT